MVARSRISRVQGQSRRSAGMASPIIITGPASTARATTGRISSRRAGSVTPNTTRRMTSSVSSLRRMWARIRPERGHLPSCSAVTSSTRVR